MTIASEIQLLAPSALIELFVLDANKYAGGVLYWHAGTNGINGDIVWGGQIYSRFPIEAAGFDKRSGGTTPRPTITAANIGGTIAASARQYGDFMGCKITRIRTFARYLDAANFSPAVNPSADPTAAFPPDIFYVDRKAAETPQSIQWELAAAFDMSGVMLPRRQVIQNCCAWVYRSAECGFTGGAVATEDGTATGVLANDKCGKRLSDCRLRYPQPATLPYGGYPAVGLIH